jgi:cytochrome d ubiquinol oxidase subunit I
MTLDPLILSRLQFFWVIGWHILLPAFTIGLASFIAVMEGAHIVTGREVLFRISSFWVKIFSVAFGMGVVSGIVMPFQFGTNWSRYSADTANILSPLFAYEGLVAFFLEAAFLGVLLFGRSLVPRWAHFVAALMVALGTLFSAFWILSANSWMQTPQGYNVVDGRFIPVDWFAIVFNPSFPYRFAHMVCAAYITTGFVVLSVGAWLIRKGRFAEEGRVMFSITLWLLLVLVPLQIFLGDQHGLNTLEHQPAKIAAIEAIWNTEKAVPLVLFAVPDEEARRNDFAIEIPKGASLFLKHDPDAEIKGIDAFAPDTAPVAPVFFAFRAMVGIGVLMLVAAWIGVWATRRGMLPPRWMLWTFAGFTFSGWAATECGWIVTEIGRQPWLVTGVLRTADAVGGASGAQLGASLTGYVITYAGMFLAYMVVLTHLAGKGTQA